VFTTDGLSREIEKCHQNITLFEKAANEERAKIEEYKVMIEHLREKNDALEAAASRIHIVTE